LPQQIAFDQTNNVYVSDSSNNRISMYNSTGGFIRDITATNFTTASGVAVDSAGNVWATELGGTELWKFDAANNFTTSTVYNIGITNFTTGGIVIAVPEPGTLLLGGIAAACGGGGVWWKRRKGKAVEGEQAAGEKVV
jgi:hypothetical protein